MMRWIFFMASALYLDCLARVVPAHYRPFEQVHSNRDPPHRLFFLARICRNGMKELEDG
jgi:hypothetical protein